jgi:predicted anti-sigma-YlaC factor YlaD
MPAGDDDRKPSRDSSHLAREQLRAFALGQLAAADLAFVEAHLRNCDTCWDVIEETSHSDPLVRVLESLRLLAPPSGELFSSDLSDVDRALFGQLEASALGRTFLF